MVKTHTRIAQQLNGVTYLMEMCGLRAALLGMVGCCDFVPEVREISLHNAHHAHQRSSKPALRRYSIHWRDYQRQNAREKGQREINARSPEVSSTGHPFERNDGKKYWEISVDAAWSLALRQLYSISVHDSIRALACILILCWHSLRPMPCEWMGDLLRTD